MWLSVKAPAKINLALDVRHKRTDGYHDVRMVMTTIDLADRVEIMGQAEDQITIKSSNGYVPNGKKNLAYKAASLLKSRFAIQAGFVIHLIQEIHVDAGFAW